MYKKLLVAVALLAMLTTVLAACSIKDTAGPGGPTVHMGSADFIQNTITISKGQSVTLINDASDQHIITNGTWASGTPKLNKEDGAPLLNQTFNGTGSNTIGPFTTSGSFKYLCTVHPGMNLTVTVQ